MISKINVLVVALIGSVLAFALHYLSNVYCSTNDFSCTGNFNIAGVYLLIFVPLLFFSIITYFMSLSVFRAWAYFAAVWVPLHLLLMFLLPEDNAGGGLGIPAISYKALLLVFSLFAFSLVSALIIVIKYLMFWWNKK